MKQKARQSSLEPVRSPLKNFDVREIESVIPVRGEYLALNSKIEEDGEYEVIHLDEKFLPVDKRQRYNYLQHLQLSVPIQIFRYSRSGSLGI